MKKAKINTIKKIQICKIGSDYTEMKDRSMFTFTPSSYQSQIQKEFDKDTEKELERDKERKEKEKLEEKNKKSY